MFAPLATEEFSVGRPINIPWGKCIDLTDLCLNNTVMITQCKCKPRVLAYLIIVPVKLIVICANCEYKFILTLMIDSHNPSPHHRKMLDPSALIVPQLQYYPR